MTIFKRVKSNWFLPPVATAVEGFDRVSGECRVTAINSDGHEWNGLAHYNHDTHEWELHGASGLYLWTVTGWEVA